MKRATVAAVALLAAACAGTLSPEQEQKLRGRVAAYLDTLKAGAFEKAYQEFWKTHPRRPEEMEALLALQWQNDGTFSRYEIVGVQGLGASEADVSVSITMLVRDPATQGEKERTSVKTWRWSTQRGDWYFHGDYHGPG